MWLIWRLPFNKLDIAADPNVLIRQIVTYLHDYYGVSPVCFGSFNKDIEELHSEVEDRLNHAMSTESIVEKVRFLSVYNQLVFLFTSVINEIQNGPSSNAHCRLVKSLGPNDSLITFNWDTLIDRALLESKNWNMDTGYGVVPAGIYRDEWHNADPSKKSGVKLIKLHGSTNWLTSYIVFDEDEQIMFTHDGGPETLFAFESTVNPYSCYDGRYLPGYQDLSYGYYPPNLPIRGKPAPEGHLLAKFLQRTPFTPKGSSDKSGLVSMPLIIPPVKHKNYSMFGQLFENLWRQAETELVLADRIVVLGYSFPVTDIRTTLLFEQAFMKRDTVPTIVIVNPSPDAIVDLFSIKFGIPTTSIVVHREFMTESFDFMKLRN